MSGESLSNQYIANWAVDIRMLAVTTAKSRAAQGASGRDEPQSSICMSSRSLLATGQQRSALKAMAGEHSLEC